MKLEALRQLPKDKLQKIVLVCIVTLCAVAGVIQMYVLKGWHTLDDTKDRIVTLNDQIREAEQKVKQAAQDEVYREQLRSFVDTQQAAMISGDPFAWVVREVSLLAEKHPVRVGGLSPGARVDTTNKSKFSAYTTRIEVTGTYDQIGNFIRDLENQFPTAQIRALSVSGSATDQGQHRATLELVLLVQPEQPAKKMEEKKAA